MSGVSISPIQVIGAERREVAEGQRLLETGLSTQSPVVGQRSNEMCGQTAYVKITDIRLHWNVLLYDACESAEQTSPITGSCHVTSY